MPELPEVETTRRGIAPSLEGRRVEAVRVFDPRLRWPVPAELAGALAGQRIEAVRRRAKYLLLETAGGTLILHLGMSGSLRVSDPETPRRRHDHLEIRLDSGRCLRLHDPRRFGAALWTREPPAEHPLLAPLGPEPLGEGFDGAYLRRVGRGRRQAIKPFIMNNRIVVGVGNIYANEALFRAGIHPRRAAGRISARRMEALVEAIRAVLAAAIEQGGTTLRDFLREDGQPGYFRQRLEVYERGGEPCPRCTATIRQALIGQRSSYYCPRCQR